MKIKIDEKALRKLVEPRTQAAEKHINQQIPGKSAWEVEQIIARELRREGMVPNTVEIKKRAAEILGK